MINNRGYLDGLDIAQLSQLKNNIEAIDSSGNRFVKLYLNDRGQLDVNRVQIRDNPNPTLTAKIANVFTNVLNRRKIIQTSKLLSEIEAVLKEKGSKEQTVSKFPNPNIPAAAHLSHPLAANETQPAENSPVNSNKENKPVDPVAALKASLNFINEDDIILDIDKIKLIFTLFLPCSNPDEMAIKHAMVMSRFEKLCSEVDNEDYSDIEGLLKVVSFVVAHKVLCNFSHVQNDEEKIAELFSFTVEELKVLVVPFESDLDKTGVDWYSFLTNPLTVGDKVEVLYGNKREAVTLDSSQIEKIFTLVLHLPGSNVTPVEIKQMTDAHVERIKDLLQKISEKVDMKDPVMEKFLKIGAFLIAHKTLMDAPYSNTSIAEVFGLDIDFLNQLELYFLRMVDFNLGLSTPPDLGLSMSSNLDHNSTPLKRTKE